MPNPYSLHYTYEYVEDGKPKSNIIFGSKESMEDIVELLLEEVDNAKDFFQELKLYDPNTALVRDYLEEKDPTP